MLERGGCLLAVLLTLVAYCSAQNTTCSTDEDCSNLNLATVMYAGVCDTSSGICSCNSTLSTDCFHISGNMCAFTLCGDYTNTTNECRLGKKSRTTALLLSIFLINFGAANFYIEQYALAIPQIVLGLLVCVFQIGSCAAACVRDDKEKTTISCILCCSINTVVSLAIFSWWIADLVIFALNDRMDGDGCPLYT